MADRVGAAWVRLVLILAAASACRSAPAPAAPAAAGERAGPAEPGASPEPRPPRIEDFVRTRCATDGRDVVMTWRGRLYAYPADEAPRHLFDLVGMNVARCGRDADGWYLTSRELMLYLDPATGEVLHRWRNPWTGREVPVVHVANDPVQARLRAPVAFALAGDRAVFGLDIPLYYPAPGAGAGDGAEPAMLQGGEFFTLSAPAADLDDPATPAVSAVALTWHRVGPWLPWMEQGGRPGYLVYSARGARVSGVAALDPVLREELDDRLPRYRRAPGCYLAAPNATSWTYFRDHQEAYRRGARFPLPAAERDDACAGAAR